MATKLSRMMTSIDGLLPTMSHDSLITWSCKIQGSFTGGGSARKRLSRRRLLVYSLLERLKYSVCLSNYTYDLSFLSEDRLIIIVCCLHCRTNHLRRTFPFR